jgi:nitroreductase
MPEMTLFEAIRTLRAVCEFTTQPVSDEALRTILDLAVCAPSGGNRQSWEFIAMRDPATRRAIQDYYWQVFLHAMRPRPSRDRPSGRPSPGGTLAARSSGPLRREFTQDSGVSPRLL